ncbi:putative chaperone protein DNAj [Trypanosoma rangeli]|uniref:Putative chaperone protein DNAj n=1 Tax=Trypanosoma rangeli TaxID=5698 RepID=A0A3R7MIW9_TRYRA|nr:putative chaperone protein DNAj [Trypanosoma rangeli]RNF03330.1 putative chaperone protein DNAj [Trypanosoma rangeli]|eukprot:RNF03330.1 putative chaperone protein DNAj [Trypanosoma rangeli]
MHKQQDYYTLLGVSRTASKDGIREAYKLRALELHPDKNPEGEAVFKLVLNAYQVLGSPTKRMKYDQEMALRDGRRPAPTAAWRQGPRPTRGKNSSPGAPNPAPAPSFSDGASRKPVDENLFEDIYKQYQKGTYGGSVPIGKDYKDGFRGAGANQQSFSEWFKRKQEELRQAEEVFKAKLDYAKKLEVEEKRRAEEWRRLQQQREREREEELERARAQREWEGELLRREKETAARIRKAEEEKVKLDAYTEVQKKQQEHLDAHLRDLAMMKKELEDERRRLAAERELARQESTDQQEARRERQKKREEEMALELQRAEAKIEVALAHQADYEAYEREREEQRLRDENARKLEEEYRRQTNLHEEETQRQFNAAQEEARRKASEELDGKRRAILEQLVKERQRHQDDVEAMRRETDRIEAEMQAKLDALRKAKKSGKPINLDEWKL